MTKFWKKIVGTLLAASAGMGILYAAGIVNPVVNEPALAYSKRYVIDLQNAQVNTVTATAVFSSATLSNGTFTTGQVSTGSITIADNTKLAAALATEQITVTSTSGAKGDALVVTKLNKPGAFVFIAGRDWNYGATTALTAASIKSALDTIPDFQTSRSGAILYSTASVTGATYNAMGVTTNNTGTLTIAHPTFTGGRDATVIGVNGYNFRFGINVTIGAAAANSATNLATAINAKTTLSGQVVATPSSANVTLQSVKAGSLWNFSLRTSNTAAATVLHPTMIGGATPSWTLGGKNITIAAHGLSLALPVLYSVGSGAPAISGLTAQTTYYVIPVDANTLELASSQGNALAGTGIVLASSSTLTAAKSYTLAPLAFAVASGTGFKWQVSSDNSNWSDLDISSVTYTVPGSQAWDLGQLDFRYLGFNVTGPASGGLNLQLTANGSFTP